MSVSEVTQLETSMEEGKPLRVNEWGTNGMWMLCLFMALLALLTLWSAVRGNSEAVAPAIAFSLFSLFCARIAILGLVVKDDGVRVRTFWRTFDMTWGEVDDFELRGTVFRTSLRVKRADGKVIGAQGLAARTAAEKRRAQLVLDELRQRMLERQH